ncbi:hypothetical protein BDZ89DRAFT_1118607 [Hymenopellis radicata]|nr:hypothetical protein BDZ89DRAFT_1118607 [Hymenopellis radicata]
MSISRRDDTVLTTILMRGVDERAVATRTNDEDHEAATMVPPTSTTMSTRTMVTTKAMTLGTGTRTRTRIHRQHQRELRTAWDNGTTEDKNDLQEVSSEAKVPSASTFVTTAGDGTPRAIFSASTRHPPTLPVRLYQFTSVIVYNSMVLYGWDVWLRMSGVGGMYGVMQVTLCRHTRTWLYGSHGGYLLMDVILSEDLMPWNIFEDFRDYQGEAHIVLDWKNMVQQLDDDWFTVVEDTESDGEVQELTEGFAKL